MTQPRTPLSRILRTFAAVTTGALALVTLAMGCSSSNDSSSPGATCGAGTKLVNGVCVPEGTGGTAGTSGAAGTSAGSGGGGSSAGTGGSAGGTAGSGGSPVVIDGVPCPPANEIAFQCDAPELCPVDPQKNATVCVDGDSCIPIHGIQAFDVSDTAMIRYARVQNVPRPSCKCGDSKVSEDGFFLGLFFIRTQDYDANHKLEIILDGGQGWRVVPNVDPFNLCPDASAKSCLVLDPPWVETGSSTQVWYFVGPATANASTSANIRMRIFDSSKETSACPM